MSQPELDEPHMVWTGPLPAHLRRQDDPQAADEADDGFVERFEVPPRPRIALIVGLALAIGMGIGALAPLALRWAAARPARPTAIAAEVRAVPPLSLAAPDLPAPQVATAEPAQAPPDVSPAPAPAVEPARAAHKAVAHAAGPAKVAPVRLASAEPPCRLEGSQADYQVCAFPAVAAADRDLQQAYREARNAGVPNDALTADETAWRRARETASHMSAMELAIAYRTHIAQVQAMASEAPH